MICIQEGTAIERSLHLILLSYSLEVAQALDSDSSVIVSKTKCCFRMHLSMKIKMKMEKPKIRCKTLFIRWNAEGLFNYDIHMYILWLTLIAITFNYSL